MNERERLEQAIARFESQRGELGDDIVEIALAPLRKKLYALRHKSLDRKVQQMTVLVVRSSPPEDQSGNVSTVLETILEPIIQEHDGQIERQVPGSILATWGTVFGIKGAPERAIRSALAIREQIERWRSEAGVGQSPSKPASTLQLHIGIHTSTVPTGEPGFLAGAPVYEDLMRVAHYLGQAAPPGEILISHETYRHVRGVFEVRPQVLLETPDCTECVPCYLVDLVKARTFPLGTYSVEGIETRMVERDAELDYLRTALQAVVGGNQQQMVTIIGDDGIGKSRLLHEFETWMELLPERIFYLKGRTTREAQKLPYALIRDLFSFRFQIRDGDRASVVQEKMERGIQEVLGQPEEQRGLQLRSHFIGHLLGFDFGESVHLRDNLIDAQQVRDRAQTYLRDYLKAATERWPTVILLEDIDRADDSSLDALNHLAMTTAARPLFILCTARPFLFENHPQWGEGPSLHTQLELAPLSDRASRQLVEEILQGLETIPEVLTEFIIGKAQGNPLQIEELIKLLIESDVIIKEEENSWVDPVGLVAMQVPATLRGIVQARLDLLLSEEETVLRCASIIGDIFEQDAIRQLLGIEGRKPSDTDISRILERLCHQELIFSQWDSTVVERTAYVFKHSLLRELVQESILPAQKQAYHGQAAAWLANRSGERSGEYVGIIADHLEQAGQLEEAIALLTQAGQQAAAQFANAEAVHYLTRALELLPQNHQAERYALLLVREEVYEMQGARQAQAEDLALLQELALEMGDNRCKAEVTLSQADYAEGTGDYPTAGTIAEAAIKLLQTMPQESLDELRATGYLCWGRSLWRQGEYGRARTLLEQTLFLAQKIGHPRLEADAMRGLGNVTLTQSDFAEAQTFYERALHICRQIGDRRGECGVLNNLGALCYHQDDYLRAKTNYEQSLYICREIGDRRTEGALLLNLGLVSTELRNYPEAWAYYKQALSISQEVGNRWGQGIVFGNLGMIAHRLGDYDQARDYYTRSLRIHLEIGDRQSEGRCRSSLSLLFHHLGDHHTAREYSLQALRITQELGDRHIQGFALTHQGHALTALGHLDKAVEVYNQALELRSELGQQNLITETLGGLARVELQRQDPKQALHYVEKILTHLESGTLAGTEEPFLVYLTCFRALRANQDPRATAILETAHRLLQEQISQLQQAETLADPDPRTQTESFVRSFRNVATHQEILHAFSKE
jgi:tetratricopeptide (TPR) repeat protein